MNMSLFNDRFLFDFKQKEDKEFVVSNGAWVVNGVTLVIKKFTSESEVIDFTVAELWVRVMGIPYYQFTEQVFSDIQTLLSNNKPIIKPLPLPRARFLCFQTEIDLKKPLNPGFYVGENRFVVFKYKNIGDFCYNCGMMDHIQSNCDQEFPKERSLDATCKTKTPVYGPWLKFNSSQNYYERALKLVDEEKKEDVKECEKTLPYPQFFIQLKYNFKLKCNSDSKLFLSFTHSFRFPCSYLDSTDLATSRAREVIVSEISKNAPSQSPLPLKYFEEMPVNWPIREINGEKPKVICSLLEYLNIISKNSDDKWLPLKLEMDCVGEIEYKISELIKQKVEEEDDLLCLSLWESDIRDALAEIGYANYPYLFNVSTRAIPAERQSVEKLERKKIIGSEIDRLDPCMICSEEIFLAEEVIVLPCSHVFHSLCVHKWFEIGHKCPLCGFELPLQ